MIERDEPSVWELAAWGALGGILGIILVLLAILVARG